MPSSAPHSPLEIAYGDLLYDFCSSLLWSRNQGKRLALRLLRKAGRNNTLPFRRHERSALLAAALHAVRAEQKHTLRRPSASEIALLDSLTTPEERLADIDAYVHRLQLEEQAVLLLRDKYGIPYPEIATALQLPEGSIKILRKQALESISRWVWTLPLQKTSVSY